MKPCGKPWDQMSLKARIDSLHIRQQRIVRSVNHLGRLVAGIKPTGGGKK